MGGAAGLIALKKKVQWAVITMDDRPRLVSQMPESARVCPDQHPRLSEADGGGNGSAGFCVDEGRIQVHLVRCVHIVGSTCVAPMCS